MDIGERVEIVTYECWDATVRTRCLQHVARRGQLAPVPWKPLLRREVEPRRRCVACFWTWALAQQGMAPPPADEHEG